MLHCDACGKAQSVPHQDLGDIHLGYVKGLPGPYAVSRHKIDEQIKREYQGASLTQGEYHRAVEATFAPCGCGGQFRYEAPPRCPTCQSTREQWDLDPRAPAVLYD
jgi:hypothetical protein